MLSKRQVYEQNSPVDATCDVTNSISETATESLQGATGHLLSADRRRPTRSPSPHVLGWGTGIQSRDLPASSLRWLPPPARASRLQVGGQAHGPRRGTCPLPRRVPEAAQISLSPANGDVTRRDHSTPHEYQNKSPSCITINQTIIILINIYNTIQILLLD